MAHKFMLADGHFKMSASIAYHYELVEDRSTTKGGGRWHLDKENKILYLWGHSSDFGVATPEDIKKYLLEGVMPIRFEGYKVMHSSVLLKEMPDEDEFTELCVLN